MKLRKVITTAGFIMASITPANAQLYMCQSCPAGTYSDGTFTSCKNCLTTGVANCDSVTGKVTSCKGGYKYSTTKLDQAAYDRCVSMCRVANCRTYCYSTQGVQKTVAPYCDACPAGTWSSQGASSCTTCGTGYYSTGTATACLSCLTTGVATCDSTTGKATSCKPGYGYSNGKCTACSSGYYSAGGTSTCSNSWSHIKTYYMPGSGTGISLDAGVYKIDLQGAGGGGGGGDQGDGKGGKGGNGAQIVNYFYLPTTSSYNYSVGKGGSGGLGVVNAESNTEAKGGDGGSSSFSISGIINITAGGGKGGYGGVRGTSGKVDGAAGANAGNGLGRSGGAGGINDKGVGNEARSGKNGTDGILYLYVLNTCSNGYYLNGTSCSACTNKPDNATYTSNATSNSCSWKCNSGYIKAGNKCEICNTSCSATITDVMAVSNGGYSKTRGTYSCGYVFGAKSVYGGSVSVNGKVIGGFSCNKTNASVNGCASSTRYLICKDKLITID